MAAKKKKSSKKSKPEVSESGEPAAGVVKRFFKAYEDACVSTNSLVSPVLKSSAKKCIEDERFLTKVILEKVPGAEQAPAVSALAEAIRDSRYIYVKELYVWDLIMDNDQLVALAHLFEKGCYPFRYVELLDCLVDSYGVGRLCQSIRVDSTLACLTLDHNEFGDEGCRGLCAGLRGNTTLLKLSLCYCSLGELSGSLLGSLISNTAIREVFLDGNDLGCRGTQALIAACTAQAERETAQELQRKSMLAYEKQMGTGGPMRSAGSSGINSIAGSQPADLNETAKKTPPVSATTDRKAEVRKGKKKRRGSSAKRASTAPSVGPWLSKLHLADNGIDACDKDGGHVASLACMRLVRRLLANSACLEELDLDDNLIGDLGGRELVAALKERSEANHLPGVRVRVTHRMQAETFKELCKLGSGAVKKKKRQRKGTKKKAR